MLTVEEALEAVLEQARPLPAEAVPLEAALRCVLAEDVAADIDLPPFDKSLVDGYAVRSDDLTGPGPSAPGRGDDHRGADAVTAAGPARGGRDHDGSPGAARLRCGRDARADAVGRREPLGGRARGPHRAEYLAPRPGDACRAR